MNVKKFVGKISGGPVIAALLMEGDSFPIEAMKQRIARGPIGGRTPADIKTEKGFLMFTLGDDLVAVAPMPAPYPWSDLEGPCATSWMWPKATPATTMRRHRSHVIVTLLNGSSDPIKRRHLLTQILKLAADLPGVIGIFWPEATVVHFPPLFIKMASSTENPQVSMLCLWADFRVVRNPDQSFGLFTTGLKPLGHLELEIPSISMQPAELRQWAMNIVTYLMDPKTNVKNGDTIGISAQQQLRVRHVPSQFPERGTVMRLEQLGHFSG
jgi:hypothetical protein